MGEWTLHGKVRRGWGWEDELHGKLAFQALTGGGWGDGHCMEKLGESEGWGDELHGKLAFQALRGGGGGMDTAWKS